MLFLMMREELQNTHLDLYVAAASLYNIEIVYSLYLKE